MSRRFLHGGSNFIRSLSSLFSNFEFEASPYLFNSILSELVGDCLLVDLAPT